MNQKPLFIAVITITLMSLPPAKGEGLHSWKQWLGPDRNGISPESDWNTDLPPEGEKVLWKTNVGLGFSPLSVDGNRAITMGYENGIDTIYCLNNENGEILWKHSYPCKIHDYLHEGGPASAPLIDENRVYTLSREADLICLDIASGTVKWAHNLVKEHDATIPLIGFTSSPLLMGDSLIVDVGIAMAFNKMDGTLLWKTEKFVESYSSPKDFPYQGSPHIAFFNGFGLVVIKPTDGSVSWSLPWKTVKFNTNSSTPVIVGDKVFFSSGYDRGCAMARIGAASEEAVLWRKDKLRSSYNTMIYEDGCLFGYVKDEFTCFDFNTGKELWAEPFEYMGSQIKAGAKYLLLSEKGEIFAADVSREGIKLTSSSKAISGRCWTIPTLCNGLLYVRNSKGEVVCLDLRM